MIRNIDQLIKNWEFEAENDGNPPKITDEEREALARELLKTQNERKKIRGLPLIVMSEQQYRRTVMLSQRMGSIHNFIRETLVEGKYVSDTAVQNYVNEIGKEKRQIHLWCGLKKSIDSGSSPE